MSKTTYYAETHIFDSRADVSVINIVAGDGKTLNIGGTTPGGSDTEIQFNNAGTLDGISSLTYATNQLSMTEPISLNNTLDLGASGKINFTGGTQADFSIEDTGSGWVDITSEPVGGKGANAPTWATWYGNLSAFEFPSNSLKELFYSIHIPHNYDKVDDEGIFFHIHLTTDNAAPTGNHEIYFEYSYGNSDAVFSVPTTVSVVDTISTQYLHRITEIPTAVLAGALEVDGVVNLRVYRDGTGSDTANYSVFVLFLDSHIKINKYSTLNRNKATGSFYT